MKLIRKITGCMFAASLLLSSQVFAIPMLNFTPASQTVNLGDQATVNVGLSGLSNEYVGAFDFNVSWDSSLLSLDSSSFDIFLDGPGDSISGVDSSTAGTVNMFEVSLGALINQDGSSDINLFSLTFNTLGLGTSALSFSAGIDPFFDFLGDDLGFALPTDISGGSIEIVDAPEPGVIWLLSAGLILLGFSQHRFLQR